MNEKISFDINIEIYDIDHLQVWANNFGYYFIEFNNDKNIDISFAFHKETLIELKKEIIKILEE